MIAASVNRLGDQRQYKSFQAQRELFTSYYFSALSLAFNRLL